MCLTFVFVFYIVGTECGKNKLTLRKYTFSDRFVLGPSPFNDSTACWCFLYAEASYKGKKWTKTTFTACRQWNIFDVLTVSFSSCRWNTSKLKSLHPNFYQNGKLNVWCCFNHLLFIDQGSTEFPKDKKKNFDKSWTVIFKTYSQIKI